MNNKVWEKDMEKACINWEEEFTKSYTNTELYNLLYMGQPMDDYISEYEHRKMMRKYKAYNRKKVSINEKS